MILTNQQKYIVEVLKQLKYLRVRQLHAMMQAHFGPLGIEIGEHRLNVMLRQLRMASNFVFLKKDLITYGQREISEHYLEAIDVMLELTENMQVNVDGFLRFADYFFDGLFADWAVLDKISQSQEQVHSTRRQIESVLSRLNGMQRSVEQEQTQLESKLDTLVRDAKI